jgi:radical SAM family protein/iron-sulfur cluster protein
MPYLADASLPAGFLEFPSKLQIQTVNRCNYTCPMCPYPDVTAREAKVALDGDLFRRLIDEVRAAGRRVKLCLMLQNEPLLDRRFLEFLDHAHRAEDCVTSISTVTNGSVLTRELLDELMRYERFYLTISVNATDRERYAHIHGRDLWDRVHELLSTWQGGRHRVRLSFVLDAGALDEGRAFQRYWRELGYGLRFVPIFARVDTMSVEAPVHAIDLDYGHCHYPVDTLNVLADGSVILCCNDWLHSERFGNLHQATIAEVWNSSRLRQVRRAAIAGTLRDGALCRSCDYPIRSSQRLLLEALLEPSGSPAAETLSIAPHRGWIRAGTGQPPLQVLVADVDPAAGAVLAFASTETGEVPPDILFRLAIAEWGAFNFGSLDPVWCPGKARRLDFDSGVPGAVPLRLELDRSAEEFQFFPWYCADWARTPLQKGGASPQSHES